MARPHIEFIQAQRLPWREDGLGPQRAGVRSKLLSCDEGSGALSAIVQYPPGWSRPAETVTVDEEFFVLDGEFAHNKDSGERVQYTPDCFGFWPQGFARGVISAPGGATVLTFLSGPLTKQGRPNFDPARLVERTDIREGEWIADLAAMGLTVMATTSKIRRLRSDPISGEITYVTAVIPYMRETQSERHPVIQEIFVLAGGVAGNTGTMLAGAYTWRPAHVTHGPYGTTTGAVFLFRSHGGPQSTEHDPPIPFKFDVPHQPVLPPELETLGREPYKGFERY
jgi:hypothetical protein